MHDTMRTQAILDLLAERTTLAAVAQRFAVDEAEVRVWRTLYLEGAASALAHAPRRRAMRVPTWLAVPSGVALGLLAWIGHARSQGPGTCAQTLPSPMKTFCAGSPAVASQINGNFSQLIAFLQQKVGAVGSPDVTVTGSFTAQGVAAQHVTAAQTVTVNGSGIGVPWGGLNFGNSTRQMVSLWGQEYGIGVQNSTQYFRTGGHFAWYVGGSHSNNTMDAGPGGRPLMILDTDGTLALSTTRMVDGVQSTYTMTTRRYVVDASANRCGNVVALDDAIVVALCKDEDGCKVNLAMVNFDGTGNVASRSSRLFISQSSRYFRFDNDAAGNDGDGGVSEWSAWDCYLGDAESATDWNNGRADWHGGLGLLNARGGSNDSSTSCRAIFED